MRLRRWTVLGSDGMRGGSTQTACNRANTYPSSISHRIRGQNQQLQEDVGSEGVLDGSSICTDVWLDLD
jgi:hypothetical protein